MARQRSYRIKLSQKERKVTKHIQKHTNSLNLRMRCAVILAADENRSKAPKTYAQIASISGACGSMVIVVLKAFTENGFAFATVF